MARLFERGSAAVAFGNAKARVRQDISHGPPHVAVVVYDQNCGLGARQKSPPGIILNFIGVIKWKIMRQLSAAPRSLST